MRLMWLGFPTFPTFPTFYLYQHEDHLGGFRNSYIWRRYPEKGREDREGRDRKAVSHYNMGHLRQNYLWTGR